MIKISKNKFGYLFLVQHCNDTTNFHSHDSKHIFSWHYFFSLQRYFTFESELFCSSRDPSDGVVLAKAVQDPRAEYFDSLRRLKDNLPQVDVKKRI